MKRTTNQLIPFDSYCPSIQNKLHFRICSICKQYIPSAARLRNHYKVHQQRYASKFTDLNNNKEEEITDENDPIDPSDLPISQINIGQHGVFLFTDMTDWLKSDFEDDPMVEPKLKSIAANAMAMIRQEKQLVAEATAVLAQSSITIPKAPIVTTQNDAIESVATISVDNALTSSNNLIDLTEIKVENETVVDAMEHLNVIDDTITESYDDLSDLIDKI